jgi:putative hydrolase of the HAD superfamily
MKSPIHAVFLDAGNTLLFPQLEGLVQDFARAGIRVQVEHFHQAEREGKRKLDEALWPQLRSGNVPRSSNGLYWTHYLSALMEQIDAPESMRPTAIEIVVNRFRDIHTWSRVLPETVPVLTTLKSAGYSLAVISNSDGSVEGELQRAGLRKYLDFVIDSAIVGVEKPHPEIFQVALERARLKPQEAIYVGDTYATDIGGAQLAGLRGVLLDRVGAYPEASCPRITSLSHLTALLEKIRV